MTLTSIPSNVSADPFAIIFFAGVGIYVLFRLFRFIRAYRASKNTPQPLLGVVFPPKDPRK